MLYCSQRPYIPVETSQSRGIKGGLQTTIEFYFGFLYSNVGFYARISPAKQDLLFFLERKVSKRKPKAYFLIFIVEIKQCRQKKT